MQLNRSTRKKPTLQNSALVPTRRALRSAPALLPVLMSALVTQAKAAQTPRIYFSSRYCGGCDRPPQNIKDDSLRQMPEPVEVTSWNARPQAFTLTPPMSKHSSSALYDFIRACVGPDDPSSTILSTMEKASLRSPEYSLSDKTPHIPFPTPTPRRPHLQKAAHLYSQLRQIKQPHSPHRCLSFLQGPPHQGPSESLESIASDILSLTGKTTGVDHRVTLYAMLSAVPASDGASMGLAISLPTLMVKETNDIATSILTRILPAHLTHPLKQNTAVPTDITNVIARDE
ncbi:hypothetical protein BU15DRAFT_81273 [Melanogaster broomeanus]|nr:hypothetical protein BU15DRAFT_81273 [Melanogaster broomeanus]